ncbi:MAG: hypothetical protein Ct9H90mP2_00400 [Dehalococcoidia bacterium]|nr:MAG: hypothetical protein Ct9H90mP2_00400 [Dehalococcoidia bacterium]
MSDENKENLEYGLPSHEEMERLEILLLWDPVLSNS